MQHAELCVQKRVAEDESDGKSFLIGNRFVRRWSAIVLHMWHRTPKTKVFCSVWPKIETENYRHENNWHVMSLFWSNRLPTYSVFAVKNRQSFCFHSKWCAGMHFHSLLFFPILLFTCAVDTLIGSPFRHVCTFRINVNDSIHSLTHVRSFVYILNAESIKTNLT